MAIDDFGTGYSGLGYLKSLEINEVKIDRCFISHIQYNAYNYRLLRNIIELAHSVGIQVCCEGVETEEELMTILELKPDILQGFFFAKPSTREEIEKMYFTEEIVEYRRKFQNQKKLSQFEEEETKNFLQQVQREEPEGCCPWKTWCPRRKSKLIRRSGGFYFLESYFGWQGWCLSIQKPLP